METTVAFLTGNPFAVINEKFQILDCNPEFEQKFSHSAGDEILNLFRGTDSFPIVFNFVNSELRNFSFEYSFTEGQNFTVFLQKMDLLEQELCCVQFVQSVQAKLFESRINHFYNLIESGGIPAALTDNELKIVFVSCSFEKVFNKSLDKIYNTHILSFFKDYLTLSELNELNEHLSLYKQFKFTINLNGSSFYETKITPVTDTVFNFRYFVISLNDISQYMLYQNQLQEAYKKEIYLNKLKTTFLENMSHEIRTPLNAVIGYTEFINDCIENANFNEIKEFADAIKEVLKRILNLFNNIVEYALIDNGEIVLDREKINLNEVIRGVIFKKQADADEKDIHLCFFSDESSVAIFTDWIKVEKIFLELVDNAIKFTERGEVNIRVEKAGNFADITVTDTGKGINEPELERLLKPFEQGESGYTRQNQGAGLGLSIAYGLTRLLGGSFDIKTLINAGTQIQIRFPLYNIDHDNS